MQTLNGEWTIAPDPDNVGRAERWFDGPRPEAVVAPVPGVIQQALPGYHGVAWYWHTFRTLESSSGQRVLLHFGAVDYLGEVWLNGQYLGSYEGGETPFEFDVTDTIREDGENVLAVRVLNPTNTAIDGYLLSEVPHKNKVMTFVPGSMLNTGGILYPVTLRVVPPVYIRDVFARPDPHTGEIAVTVTVFNGGEQSVPGHIRLKVGAAADGSDLLHYAAIRGDFLKGESVHEAVLQVRQPHLWDLDDPFLYRLTTRAEDKDGWVHEHSMRIGFRDFRVVDGYFHLNGKRIFLKSTHTGNHVPYGVIVPEKPDFLRRDLIYAKASGFNMVRFIAGAGMPEQFDLCDELGLMVYEESIAAWKLGDSPKLGERFDRNNDDMIRRDRNHASITVWGLLNETDNNPTYRHAVGYLPRLRTLDPTRMVLLSSGRWDEEPTVGTISNPGGTEWETVWGVEGPDAKATHPRSKLDWTHFPSPAYVGGAGDAHIYPQTPLKPDAINLIKHLGEDSKPVFLSEFGIGSLQNVISEWRNWEQTGYPAVEEGAFLREQVEVFQRDWVRLGFDDVYPFAEDMLRESQRLHARQRALGFDLVRANPHLNGYNLTGMLDHALTGEGLWTFFREWKPATFDATAEGWASLRWCLLADVTHTYAGRAITLEASLANEGMLKPGDYPAKFRILGPNGIAWEKAATVHIPDPAPLAVLVLKETIPLDGPAGVYTVAANLEQGGAPAGGRLKVYVSDVGALPKLSGKVALWGVEPSAEKWLTERGVTCGALFDAGTGVLSFGPTGEAGDTAAHPKGPANAPTDGAGEVIVVGLPSENERTPERMAALMQRIANGATAVFLKAAVFANGADSTAYLPLANRGKADAATDWLYHKECVMRRHPVFDGLQTPGIMDWDYYGPVVPHDIYEGLDAPDEMIAASFTTGHHKYKNGYAWGLLMGMYKHGAGRLILSTPYLLENLGTHPAADRLLVNLVQWAFGTR